MHNLPSSSLLIIGLVIFWSCNTEDTLRSDKQSLVGIWFNEHSSKYKGTIFDSRLEYHFRADSSVEVIRKIIDQSSGKLLGYQAKTNAKYSLKGDSLKISHLSTYVHDASKNYYSALEELIFIGPQGDLIVLISFDQTKTKLTFHYLHCPSNSDCIDYQVFTLENK